MLALPKSGYAARMAIYLSEMYPIPEHLLVSSLLYISIAVFVRSTHDLGSPVGLGFAVSGIASLFAIMLMIRLMDELKDRIIDLRLFPERPFPSGKVLESDITFSIIALSVLFVCANLWVGTPAWVVAMVLGYSLLMFKHFFIPHKLRENLLLTLATHNVFVPIVYVYVLTLVANENGLALASFNWSAVLLVLMYWAMSFAWEIARKIRAAEEENAYVTYSRIFGPTRAVLVAGFAQTASFAIGLYFYRVFSLSAIFLALLALGYATAIAGHARFVRRPSPASSKLRPFAEAFILCVLIAHSVEHGLLR